MTKFLRKESKVVFLGWRFNVYYLLKLLAQVQVQINFKINLFQIEAKKYNVHFWWVFNFITVVPRKCRVIPYIDI